MLWSSMVYSLQQKYSFTTYSENNKARCKKYFLFVKMTMPICVSRKLLRMKSTAIQENNSNFKKNSFIPQNMFRPWPRGSATAPQYPPTFFILESPLDETGGWFKHFQNQGSLGSTYWVMEKLQSMNPLGSRFLVTRLESRWDGSGLNHTKPQLLANNSWVCTCLFRHK